ncbi:MAG: transposase [Ardenticatenaceae bacterium]|nr:transposase [Ardenticatenaceae bacterium]
MYEYRKRTPAEQKALVKQRVMQGYPPHEPPHPIQDKEYYLLTATCYEHAHHMHTPQRRQDVLNQLFAMMQSPGVEIRAWTVLLNHYHLLAFVPNFAVLGECFKKVHGPTAVYWNREDNTAGRKVWYRFTDRAIRSDAHYYTTLNYIHYNPVKHGCAASPYDWQESSVHWYLEHHGREWLRDLWRTYPVRNYGEGWDD